MRGRVRSGAGDDGRPLAHRLERGAEQVEPLAVRQRRALAGRAGDDDPVGAVVDQVRGELLERVEVDRPVRPERGDDRRQNTAEHAESLRRSQGDTRAMAIRARARSLARRLVLRGASAASSSALGHEVVAPTCRATTSPRRQYDYAAWSGRSRTRSSSDTHSAGSRSRSSRRAPRLPRGDPADRERLCGVVRRGLRRLRAR